MPDPHYTTTGNVLRYKGRFLYRIRATRDIPHHGIRKGTVGGFVESMRNLTENAWISGDAKVYGNACVRGTACICHKSEVGGSAIVDGQAEVSNNAQAYDRAQISGNAHVFGRAHILGDAKIRDNAQVFGDATVYGAARVSDSAKVQQSARVAGLARIQGNSRIQGKAQVHGSAYVSGGVTGEYQTYVQIGGTADVHTTAGIREYTTTVAPETFRNFLLYLYEKTFGNMAVRGALNNNAFKISVPDSPPRLIKEFLAPAIEQFGVAEYIPEGWEDTSITIQHLPAIGMRVPSEHAYILSRHLMDHITLGPMLKEE
ncbi:MAG: hypothetical protein DRJ03_10920 [Chloroflexi bacterium]|nr:MAG: hypothetical protein DRJ03_10920 [Chloroflexota bacterium]